MSGVSLRCAVVLCAWNGERFLPAQLDSLRAQTRQPDAYVLSDDASTDASWALLVAFAEEQQARGVPVVVHRNPENLGYVAHFAQALARSDADLLFPCDQDDVWHPDKIALMHAPFVDDPALLVLHGDGQLVDANGAPTGRGLLDVLETSRDELDRMHAGEAFAVLLRRNIVTGAIMALRREVLALATPFARHWSHDEWMAIIASMHGRVDTLERMLIDYRQHGGNQIGASPRGMLQRHLGIGVSRRDYLQRQVARLQELSAHPSVPEHARPAIDDRLLHCRARANLPTGVARLPHVLRELRRGGYDRFGSGLRSAIVDLLGLD